MPTPEEELQNAVDRGELRVKDNVQLKRQIEATERRWVVMQVKDIATQKPDWTPAQVLDLCELLWKFITPPPVA